MEFPSNLKYTKDHEWVLIENDIAIVGITDFAQKELGDIVYVEIETLNETLKQGDEFGAVEAVKTVSELFMPISGEIVEINQQLLEADNAAWVNESPYQKGWMIKIKPNDITEFEELLNSDDYKALLGL